MKYLLIDERMRDVEKQTLKNLGYELIEINLGGHCYDTMVANFTSHFVLSLSNL